MTAPDVPMPVDLSEDEIGKWLGRVFIGTRYETRSSKQAVAAQARAVRALVESERAKERAMLREKVREAVTLARKYELVDAPLKIRGWTYTLDEIVARVLGEEAPRG